MPNHLYRLLLVAPMCAALPLLASPQHHGQAAHSQGVSHASGTVSVVTGPGYTLRFVGAQRETVMKGRRESQLDLRTLANKPGLIGLGPVNGLSGEMTIVEGRPALSRVTRDGTVELSDSFAAGAPFFVWAEVTGVWRAQPVPKTVNTTAELERFVSEAGGAQGLTRAFPFKVTGSPTRVSYHVLDAKPGVAHPPGTEGHKAIQKRFATVREAVILAGFHSSEHGGVFTHMGSSVHMHVVDDRRRHSGHVEDMEIGGAALTLWLPTVL